MSGNLDDRVEVSLWTVLMAIRYGMGRMSYANQDAADLARQHWDLFPPDIKRQIKDDVRRHVPESAAWGWVADK
jgi:hypothetical protein